LWRDCRRPTLARFGPTLIFHRAARSEDAVDIMVGKVFVPPIFKAAPLATVTVPPLLARFAVKPPRSNTPTETVRLLVTLHIGAQRDDSSEC